MANETLIDTGDVVHHIPTGEDWLVAFVQGEYLSWCGWPEGRARLSDCVLREKATPEARRALLKEIAEMSVDDSRRRHAKRILEAENAKA